MSLRAQIDHTSRYIAPGFLALILVTLTFLPLRIPGISTFIPMVDAIVIYYWCIYRPSVMPQWFVFLLGIYQDTFYGTALGLSSLTNIILRTIAITQRRLFLKESFVVIWGGFMIFALGVGFFKYIVYMLLSNQFITPNAALIQWMFSIALYPLLHWLCNVFYLSLPDQSHA